MAIHDSLLADTRHYPDPHILIISYLLLPIGNGSQHFLTILHPLKDNVITDILQFVYILITLLPTRKYELSFLSSY